MSDMTKHLEAFEAARMAYCGPDLYHTLRVVDPAGRSLPVHSVWRDGKDITVTLDVFAPLAADITELIDAYLTPSEPLTLMAQLDLADEITEKLSAVLLGRAT